MNQGFGGLQATGVTATINNILSAGTVLTNTHLAWAAISASPHGDASVSADTTNGRLTLVPGTYRVDVNLSVEGSEVSGLSSEDATVNSALSVELVRPDSTTGGVQVVAGSKSLTSLLEGLLQHVTVNCFIEITRTMLTLGENKISIMLKSALAGDSALDVIIREARFLATRID